MITFDTETCGLHGCPVTIQYAEDNGPVKIHSIWTEQACETMALIEYMMQQDLIGFNLSFDMFHLNKIYNMLGYLHSSDYPEDKIDELGVIEEKARNGFCLKPKSACDLMLHAKKSHYQSLMDRKPITISKVPIDLAEPLAIELESRLGLKDIYFAKRKKKREQWSITDVLDKEGNLDKDFKNLKLDFCPSSALKALAVDMGLVDPTKVKYFNDIDCDIKPLEHGYAPFALAGLRVKNLAGEYRIIKTGPGSWKGTWPDVIRHHITHWAYNQLARKYASDDVIYTREIYDRFNRPTFGDNDSELACMVAAVRWRGFEVDIEKLKALKAESLASRDSIKFRNSPSKVLRYITEDMDDIEKIAVDSTKKVILESISKWRLDDGSFHPSAIKAQEVLSAKIADKEISNYDKLLQAGRFHPSFKVIGTLSSRMAGDGGFNPQGVQRTKRIRSAFTLSSGMGEQLDGGDFDAFEVCIADAEYNDPKLHAALLSGRKIHALFGASVFGMSYDEIMASAGTANDKYNPSKSAVFAMLYGGEAYTLSTRLGVDVKTAELGYLKFASDYPGVGKSRTEMFDRFRAMVQPKGIGSAIEWKEPAEYVESMLGFKRYFTLEIAIMRALFELAQDPPRDWTKLRIKVVRRDREQTICGALQSALYGAAFKIQGSVQRAGGNHRIQSTGAQITKQLQRNIWDIQPTGIHPFKVRPLNVHDEVMSVNQPDVAEQVKQVVAKTIEDHKQLIPLLAMKWKQNLGSWGDK